MIETPEALIRGGQAEITVAHIEAAGQNAVMQGLAAEGEQRILHDGNRRIEQAGAWITAIGGIREDQILRGNETRAYEHDKQGSAMSKNSIHILSCRSLLLATKSNKSTKSVGKMPGKLLMNHFAVL
jgi:hypothetical protein